jgi:putative nucleotidyltransferase with HDIG domain
MATGNYRRPSRLQRGSTVELPPNVIERTWDSVRRGDVLLRLGICLAAILTMWAIVRGWQPPFGYRTNYTPPRSLTARIDFQQPDNEKTRELRDEAARAVAPIFVNNNAPLVKLRAELRDRLNELANAETLDKVKPALWSEFEPQKTAPALPIPVPTYSGLGELSLISSAQWINKELGSEIIAPSAEETAFQNFRKRFTPAAQFEKFNFAIGTALQELENKGILDTATTNYPNPDKLLKLAIRPPSSQQFDLMVTISEVRSEEAKNRLLTRLKDNPEIGPEAAQLLFGWLSPRIKGTLTFDEKNTHQEEARAKEAIPEAFVSYKANTDILVRGNDVLDHDEIKLLRNEHETIQQQLTWMDRLTESAAVFGMFVALFVLCGFYSYYREQTLLTDLWRFTSVVLLAVLTVGLAHLASGDGLRAEMIPVLIFGMTIAIAFHQEVALLLSAEMALVVVFTLGQGLAEYVVILSAVATAVLLIGRIRSRSKLIYVGCATAFVVGLTSIGVNVLDHQPLNAALFKNAALHSFWALTSCFIVSGLLPFIEKLFGVLTDLSLFELGDPSHPLLQQLVQRAPGTYNHSINVASIAEAAAEAIGARGLLVRVGAYFHDIGKMCKPSYFIENQGRDGNRHESLNPAMSTLVIIAHIKDGADMARQHHLPQAIIDFIQQHHGTTLVEYFYNRASRESEKNPDAAEVDEASFRYPGPKPQSKEAGILMLADASESASRTLTDPTPARIENLIHDLAMKRLIDGQFDDCGLTLRELATVQESLAKSLTAVYHGRVKYPDQRTA